MRFGFLFVIFIGIFAIVPQGLAADLTLSVTLSDTQQTALAYATEQENARRVGQKDCTPVVPPATEPTCVDKLPLTQAQMLAQIVAADLGNVLRNLDAALTPVMEHLIGLEPAALVKTLTKVSPATSLRIQQHLGGK